MNKSESNDYLNILANGDAFKFLHIPPFESLNCNRFVEEQYIRTFRGK